MLEAIKKKVFLIVNKLNRFGPAKKKLAGIVLVVLSYFLYGAIALVAVSPLSFNAKGLLSGLLWVCREISFWFGAIILGREYLVKYSKSFNPRYWFNGRKP